MATVRLGSLEASFFSASALFSVVTEPGLIKETPVVSVFSFVKLDPSSPLANKLYQFSQDLLESSSDLCFTD